MVDDWQHWFEQLDERTDACRLRPMREADLDEILRAIRLHDADDYEAARREFEECEFVPPYDRVCHLVAEVEDDQGEQRPVGVSGYYVDDAEASGVYWLSWTYVNPFFQGEGLGTILVEGVFETLEVLEARRLFVATSSLETYESAVDFYERHGFTHQGRLEDYYAPGEDRLILGRDV